MEKRFNRREDRGITHREIRAIGRRSKGKGVARKMYTTIEGKNKYRVSGRQNLKSSGAKKRLVSLVLIPMHTLFFKEKRRRFF